MIGCVGAAKLLLFACAFIAGCVLYVYFGPASPLLAFAFGAVAVYVFWFAMSPLADMAVANDRRANAVRAAREQAPNFAEYRSAALRISRGIGWVATVFFGGIAAICAALAIYDHFQDGGESARSLALFCGFSAALAYRLFPLAKVE